MRSTKHEFAPFSTTIFGNEEIGVFGGLDDREPSRPQFMNSANKITVTAESVYSVKYSVTALPSMHIKRGCAAGVFHYGQYYIVGGLNYSQKILRSSEKLVEDRW